MGRSDEIRQALNIGMMRIREPDQRQAVPGRDVLPVLIITHEPLYKMTDFLFRFS